MSGASQQISAMRRLLIEVMENDECSKLENNSNLGEELKARIQEAIADSEASEQSERCDTTKSSEHCPLMVSFEIPERMPPDIQMMAIWSQAWVRFGSLCKPHEQFAALRWFGSWTKAQIEKHRENQNP